MRDYSHPTMDDLVRLAKSGDQAALEKLLVNVAPKVQRFGMRMCKNAPDADDVLQDTLLTILRHLPKFERRSSFTSWVFALTRSACARRRRGLKNKPGMELAEALDELSDEYREVILLRDVESLTAPEAAESLGISVEALKSRLHRARQALRNTLAQVLEPTGPKASVTCPDIMELWSRKLEGDLDALDCAQMEKHLATCPACESACSALKNALGACRRQAARDVPVEIQEQVRAALRIWLKQPPASA